MSTLFKIKNITFGISLKLFFAFWLVIISTILISFLITKQFRDSATQEPVDKKQLMLLTQFRDKLVIQAPMSLKAINKRFYKIHKQHLIIKHLTSQKVTIPNQRPWHEVKNYLENHQLDNPVSIDFYFTQVTGVSEIEINGEKIQLFVAPTVDHKQLVGIMARLPPSLRILLVIFISFIVCLLLAKTFSRPLIAIQKASEALGQGKLSTRVTGYDQRSDEFGAVARSFNQMAAQLEDNISVHQRLLCDVSHELRSPLTRLQLAVGLVEKNLDNIVEQQKHLSRCEGEIDLLDEMIADVLTLSRLEHSNYVHTVGEVNLTNLIEQVIEDCQYLADDKNIAIELINNGPYSLSADKKLLISAISNVLNNAVKYSPAQCAINVEVTTEAEQLQVTVSDQGQGIPEQMLKGIFTPFFRVADGRERTSGGTGLGLAIAQQAIMQHQGQIYAENITPTGLKVTIKLPLLAHNK
ncbi:MAG: HAMP domain-containing protein [Alteromonadaceae bacterium]|nr:HAMP domain-containing protein [Alteromonadaceae bacterium]